MKYKFLKELLKESLDYMDSQHPLATQFKQKVIIALEDNPLENEDILPNNIKDVIKDLVKNNPNIVFGGSICLNALGLIKRKINDIDIFIDYSTNFENLVKSNFEKNFNIEGGLSETITDMNGKPVKRIGFKINDIKICCFQPESQEFLNQSKFTFEDITINLQNVNYAIQAKKLYADKTDKHKQDLNKIEEFLDNLPF